jgi:hypothetical protein
MTGEVKFWDLSRPTAVKSILAHQTSPMTSLSVHEHAFLIAMYLGLHTHLISFYLSFSR